MYNYISFTKQQEDQILKQAKKIKLDGKLLESYKKGKEFIDKQMELENNNSRNNVAVVVLAYAIDKMHNQKN